MSGPFAKAQLNRAMARIDRIDSLANILFIFTTKLIRIANTHIVSGNINIIGIVLFWVRKEGKKHSIDS